jgi:hypothetical protein
VFKSPGFAHSILWIFMGLSTEAMVWQAAEPFSALPDLVEVANPLCQPASPESEKIFGTAGRSANVGKEADRSRLVGPQQSKPSRQAGVSLAEVEKKIFGKASQFETRPQVYN